MAQLWLDKEKELLNAKEDNFNLLLERIDLLHNKLKGENNINPKFSVEPFNYRDELEGFTFPEEGKTTDKTFDSLIEMFDGSIRTNSPYSLFNIIPSPLLDTVAASTITQMYNTCSIMDAFSGKSILFEQKIARALGSLIGWNNSYGISCNGGKLTIFYAIKSAISRIAPESLRNGIPKDLVVLTNEAEHYCVEHICAILGMGANQCIRLKSKNGWSVDEEDLRLKLNAEISKGKRIAAVICCGGTTINFACDDTLEIYNTVKEVFKDKNLGYFPYFHLDSVIGWLWLNFFNETKEELRKVINDTEIRLKIEEVIRKLQGIKFFDSFAADFHKDGLCPFSTSFFISKDDEIFNNLNDGSYIFTQRDFEFGNLRSYRYTIENSRQTMGIASAWTAINRLGKAGYQEYLVDLNKTSKNIKNELIGLKRIEILNNESLGWEIVFKIKFDDVKRYENYDNIAKAFMQYCWNKVNNGEEVPLFSIVPEYKINPNDKVQTAFLLYPMSLFLSNNVKQLAKLLDKCITDFQNEINAKEIVLEEIYLEKPIR